jgi:DNA invertase Pin-like site-specific DNA recombinase
MDKSVKISDARARLFDLVDYVTGEEDGVVLIEHRDRTERAALVSERHLRYLQSTISELRRNGARSFRLADSVRLMASAAEVELALLGAAERQGSGRQAGEPVPAQGAEPRPVDPTAEQLVPALAGTGRP